MYSLGCKIVIANSSAKAILCMVYNVIRGIDVIIAQGGIMV